MNHFRSMLYGKPEPETQGEVNILKPQPDRKCMQNVTLGRFRATMVGVEKPISITYSVCVCL
jgi:hypothetical protein